MGDDIIFESMTSHFRKTILLFCSGVY